MSDTYKGAIDCDIHPRVPTPRAVSQYMDEHWRDTVEVRGIETWDSIAYPPNAPLTARPDWRQTGADKSRSWPPDFLYERLKRRYDGQRTSDDLTDVP